MAKKIKVYVEPNETVGECLDRIAQMGYRPVRRIEKPVFEHTGTKDEPVHSHQSILCECVALKPECQTATGMWRFFCFYRNTKKTNDKYSDN